MSWEVLEAYSYPLNRCLEFLCSELLAGIATWVSTRGSGACPHVSSVFGTIVQRSPPSTRIYDFEMFPYLFTLRFERAKRVLFGLIRNVDIGLYSSLVILW